MQNPQVSNKGVPLWAWGLLGLGAVVIVVLLIAAAFVAYFATQPEVAEAPMVAINSPRAGEQVSVGQEVIVQMTATDPRGVTSVEFLVNGALYGSEASPIPQGQSPFISRQSWRAPTPGTYTLEVKAYSTAGGGVGQATITVYAIAEVTPTLTAVPGEPTATATATVEATPIVIVITPPAPGEPACTNGSQPLNARTGPGRQYDSRGSLIPDQTVRVIGQNSGWWQIEGGLWVSGAAGYCVGNTVAAGVPVVPAPPTPTPTNTPKPECVPNCPSGEGEWVTAPEGHLYDWLRLRGYVTDGELAEQREWVKQRSCLADPDRIQAGKDKVCLPLPCKVVAPNLVGKVVGEAMGIAVQSKLEPVIETPTGCTPTNIVASTTPGQGQTVLCHTAITLTLGCATPTVVVTRSVEVRLFDPIGPLSGTAKCHLVGAPPPVEEVEIAVKQQEGGRGWGTIHITEATSGLSLQCLLEGMPAGRYYPETTTAAVEEDSYTIIKWLYPIPPQQEEIQQDEWALGFVAERKGQPLNQVTPFVGCVRFFENLSSDGTPSWIGYSKLAGTPPTAPGVLRTFGPNGQSLEGYLDLWHEGKEIPQVPETPPANKCQPNRGIGDYWFLVPAVRGLVGWSVDCQQPCEGKICPGEVCDDASFNSFGTMGNHALLYFRRLQGRVYEMYNDGAWHYWAWDLRRP